MTWLPAPGASHLPTAALQKPQALPTMPQHPPIFLTSSFSSRALCISWTCFFFAWRRRNGDGESSSVSLSFLTQKFSSKLHAGSSTLAGCWLALSHHPTVSWSQIPSGSMASPPLPSGDPTDWARGCHREGQGWGREVQEETEVVEIRDGSL